MKPYAKRMEAVEKRIINGSLVLMTERLLESDYFDLFELNPNFMRSPRSLSCHARRLHKNHKELCDARSSKIGFFDPDTIHLSTAYWQSIYVIKFPCRDTSGLVVVSLFTWKYLPWVFTTESVTVLRDSTSRHTLGLGSCDFYNSILPER